MLKVLNEDEKKRKGKKSQVNSSDEEPIARRSVITGKKLKLHVEKTDEDLAQEEARKNLLQFMNSSYK